MEYRVEVWNNSNTTKLGIIKNKLIGRESFITFEYNGERSVVMTVDSSYSGIDYLVERNILYIIPSDGTDSYQQQFRIVKTTKEYSEKGEYTLNLEADHISMDLINTVIPDPTTYESLKVQDILDKILEGTSYIGTASYPDEVIQEFTIGGKNIYENLKDLAEKVPNTELLIHDDGTVNLLGDLGFTPPTIHTFRTSAKNLRKCTLEKDSRRMVTRMYGIGGGSPALSLKKARHRIISFSGAAGGPYTLRLSKIAPTDDCFTDNLAGRSYWLKFVSTMDLTLFPYYYHITSFAPQKDGGGSGDEIIVEKGANPSITGFSSNNDIYVEIYYSDDSGTTFYPVNYIEERGNYDRYGYVDGITNVSDIEFSENLFTDPFLSRLTYVSGKHPNIVDCSAILADGSATFTENTDLQHVFNGNKSQRIATTRYGQGCYIKCDTRIKSNESIYFGVKVLIKVLSGKVRVDVVESDSGSAPSSPRFNVFPLETNTDQVFLSARDTPVFAEVIFNGVINKSNFASDPSGTTSGLYLFLYQHESVPQTAEWIVDSFSCQPLQAATDLWIDGSTSKILWDRTYDELNKVRSIFQTIKVSIRDLSADQAEYIFPHVRPPLVIGDICRVKCDEINVDVSPLKLIKRKIRITDPGDVEIELDNLVQSSKFKQTELYLSVNSLSNKINRVLNKESRDRTLNGGPIKTAAIANHTSETFAHKTAPELSYYYIYGEGQSYNAKIIFNDFVRHGCHFIDKLVIPSGRKGVINFSIPTETGDSNHTDSVVSAGRHFDWDSNIMERNLPTELSGPSIMNDSAFVMEDDVANRLSFIKICVLAGIHPITLQNYRADSPTYDRLSAFHAFIPAGTYKDLTLVCYGKPSTGTRDVFFGTNIMITEVPLRLTYLSQDIPAGQSSLNLQVSTVGGFGYPFPENGLVKVGNGTNQEIVRIKGNRSSSGNNYNPAYRQLKYTSTLYDHYKGDPVEEYIAGLDSGLTIYGHTVDIVYAAVPPASVTVV